MREAVSFPKPEEVNIIATRNGELTQIPGTEFRTPLAPYECKIDLYFGGSRMGVIATEDITCIPLGICIPRTKHEYGLRSEYDTIARPINVYEMENTSYASPDLTTLTLFGAKMLAGHTPPENDDTIGVLAQFIGNKTTRYIDGGDSVILPPTHSERVLVWGQNTMRPDYWQPSD